VFVAPATPKPETSCMSTEELPNAAPVAGVLAAHGGFLAVCGAYGAKMSGWTAMHSLYSGAGGGLALALCGLLSVGGTKKKYMIGVHIGLLLQLLFTGVFALQSYRSYGVPAKADRFPLFVTMAGGSVIALGLMRALKPKKNKTK
jgi:hypothetical protein